MLQKNTPLQLLLFVMLLCFSANLYSQKIEFTYDEAGNRIQKKFILVGPGDGEDGDFGARKAQKFFDNLNGELVKIYPNPTSEKIIVEIENKINEDAEILLTDIKGNIIIRSNNLSQINEFDLTNQAPGTFILRLQNSKKSSSYVIIKN